MPALLAGCGAKPIGPDVGPPAPALRTAQENRQLDGFITDRSGAGVSEVKVELVGFHAEQISASTYTDETGAFHFDGLLNANSLVLVSHRDFYSEVMPVYLQGQESTVSLGSLSLVKKQAGRVRLWLAGDTMFGRRFVDLDENGASGEPGDLISPDARAENTFGLLRFVLPALRTADYRVLNFESPASTAEDSRHPFKRYSFTSHPQTLGGLTRAGIDAVSLGNNHSFDFLEAGRLETEASLSDAGLRFFGSGASETSAKNSLVDVDVNGVPLSFQGFNGILPNNFYPDPNEPWDTEYLYYAMDSPKKGGALLLSSDNLSDFLTRSQDRFAIPVLHGGAEYGEFPTEPMRDRFESAHQAGAKLVVAHHSHTVYGVALQGPENNPNVSLLSLGNFVFDQDVFETFNSFMAVVDLDLESAGNYRFVQIRLVPFHQEKYVPSLISGAQAEFLARHVGHLSTNLPQREQDGLRPAIAFADPAGIAVALRPGDYETQSSERTRVVFEDSGVDSIFPLNHDFAATSYFSSFQTETAGVNLRLARDRLIFGDFEDFDVDAELGENAHWWQTSTRYPTEAEAHSGRYSLALVREQGTQTPVNTQLRNRISFDDGAELSLGCHFKGDNAGRVDVVVQYIERGSREQIGEERLFELPAGTQDWTRWHRPLSPTAGAGHLRFVITMQAPSARGGVLYIDDCSLLEWGPRLEPGETLPSPHGYDWAMGEGSVSAWEMQERRLDYRRAPETTRQ